MFEKVLVWFENNHAAKYDDFMHDLLQKYFKTL